MTVPDTRPAAEDCDGEWRDLRVPAIPNPSQDLLICSGCGELWAPQFRQFVQTLERQLQRGIILREEYAQQVALLELEVLEARLYLAALKERRKNK